MRVQVDKKRCVGDEICTEICPEIFKMDGNVAAVKLIKVPEKLTDLCRDAEESCLAFAIIIKNN
jgi:ferredoxin